MAGKTLADWLDSSSDEDSHPRPIYRKSSNAHAVFEGLSKSHNRTPSRTQSPNAPSFSAESPVVGSGGAHRRRRSLSRNSARRSSSRASLVVGPIKGVGLGSPSDPPLPHIDTHAKSKRQQEADERRRKMEEMKERLRATLGDAVTEKITSKGEPAKVGIPILSQSDDDFPAGGIVGPNGNAGLNSLPSHLPPLSARTSVDLNGVSRRASPHHHSHGAHINATTPPPLSGYGNLNTATPPRHVVVETEVMLADRGTQTACEVEVQTDPDPIVASCPQCYAETYGHSHHNFFTCGHSGSPSVMAAAMSGFGGVGGGDPIFSKMLANRLGSLSGGYGGGMLGLHGQRLASAHNPPPSTSPHAYNGHYGTSPHYPPNQHHNQPSPTVGSAYSQGGGGGHGYGYGGYAGPDQWGEQLRFIESSIDMLIRRYNLPPPPGMEQYQPVGMGR